MEWVKSGFNEFSKGQLGNGGQNLYISANGILQRIYNYDVNDDGYPDILFANSQSMGERPPLYLYDLPLSSNEYIELPSGGSYDGVMADITNDGYDDLIVACQNNGTHTDITAFIYFGSEQGLTEKHRMELPAPDSTGVVVGDLNGNGKKDIIFICGNYLRIFYQTEYGIVPFEYTDISINSISLSAMDIDGDGYDDLYFKQEDGSLGVIWGTKQGLLTSNISWVKKGGESKSTTMSTTPARRLAFRDWRVKIVEIKKEKYLFSVNEDILVFYKCDKNRNFSVSFKLLCPGAVDICVGDLLSKGFDDIAIAVCNDKNIIEESYVFWGDQKEFSFKNTTCFKTNSAQTLLITNLNGDKINHLIVCQGGNSALHSNLSQVIAFDKNKNPRVITNLKSEDAMRIVAGKTSDKKEKQIVVINHETGRVCGDENIYIYMGGSDGYNSENRIELPGRSAVQGLMYDHNDNGYVDVLISNCAENSPHLDSGSSLYSGGPDGLKKENVINIPTIRAHGAVVGDFRKEGYLDIITGGFSNREIRIFNGGPNGYDLENPIKIVLGPKSESYIPFVPSVEFENLEGNLNEEEAKINKEFGQIRWLFTADFNGNGWLDLFVSEISGPYSYILWGGPEGFDTSRMMKLATEGVASANAADFNNNGYLDLVLCQHQSMGKKEVHESYITIYWGDADGYKESRKTQLPVRCANACTIADLNGDGMLDIFATAYNDGRERDIYSYLYYGDKEGKFSINNRKLIYSHSGCGCLAGDFNGDGYMDLAVACHKGYGNHVYKSFILWGDENGLSDERKTELPTKGPHGMCSVDIGNIMDRSDNEYYYSEKHSVPTGKTVKKVSWEAKLSKNNWIQMQMRWSENEKELDTKEWQGIGKDFVMENGDDISSLGFTGGYIQYRLMLGAKCACGTPRITSVTVEIK